MSGRNDDLADLKELATLVERASDTLNDRSNHTRRARLPRAVDAMDGESPGPSSRGEMWAVYGERSFVPCEKAVDILPPGQYTVSANDRWGIFWHKEDINLDELLILPDSRSEEVIDELKFFWTLENKFREFGFLWKRGVLLWGPAGSGKTSTLQIVSKNIVESGGISVYVTNPELTAKGLKSMRQVEPFRPLVVMLEDIDAIIDEYGETDLLALMDGELQIDNVAFVATTNYPEKLDKRFINRPSRFDIIKKIGMPSDDARHVYLSAKNPKLPQAELKKWVVESKGFSIAHLKELIVSVEVFGQPLDMAIKRLRKMGEVLPNSSGSGSGGIGFNKSYDDIE